ncbi:hypothetical protein CUJ84_Chr004887 [Rhizobium leguminosarum]|uniref:Uncharacterized protein n=1 Tax=Rhizobium leguminosarum TaxID=384 RepID=A0A2K9ZAF6_RHILE|nr:hypothetical protein CUJ84_Chr004887 [Rhizobium leguminosarum]
MMRTAFSIDKNNRIGPLEPYFFAQRTLKRALRQVSPLSLKFAARTGS